MNCETEGEKDKFADLFEGFQTPFYKRAAPIPCFSTTYCLLSLSYHEERIKKNSANQIPFSPMPLTVLDEGARRPSTKYIYETLRSHLVFA